ncbi:MULTISPECIES: signal recognition particle-docking protein FtsY [Brevibacterium]|uniref:Signal recognition particle receptor FtsY n=4 Tax=Bacteria TaxID=2 RepID=K9AWN9_9MICO|nr:MULTISPECIES: signal recognition particle-docking protein FtsY [Brevibacterium]NJE65375.1 signal recognition particle-docking protein FtsY [Brevibacterium sp. LS14]SIG98635.1 cell division protein FtsY [Mycobacteroides abscessus subsp. abscessus]EKU46957.1 signal recognition particle-docking protein FtsY [Brevibacterium casei S18]MBE4695284.1 signal recognition particle-docking protein FtsY [Brevibacterium casei]MBY3578406.1 signal recognition particle-docking protein FtsY [Brevibacterium c
MDQPIILLIVAAIVFILVVALGISLRINARRKGLGEDRSIDADFTGELSIDEISETVTKEREKAAGSEVPTEPASRLVRLRERLAKSNSGLGRGLLNLLSRDTLDEATWEEIEDTLILADVGVEPTAELVDTLRERVKVLGTRDPEEVRGLLREELVKLVDPTMDRELATAHTAGDPAVMLVVGVNGAGKTTTVGKIARVLVAEDKSVLLGAADTFRAAAAEQLTTWGSRVGVETVRGEEGADPASVAYAAVEQGKAEDADVVLIDTAGRLQNKVGLMDELRKVKRVATRPLGEGHDIDEVLLVLDATTGQNGMQQAKVFAEAVDITGIVLTKLDGTAKGGIVIAVQRELGVPVKLIGLGEGADDLAPFTAEGFVDALLD